MLQVCRLNHALSPRICMMCSHVGESHNHLSFYMACTLFTLIYSTLSVFPRFLPKTLRASITFFFFFFFFAILGRKKKKVRSLMRCTFLLSYSCVWRKMLRPLRFLFFFLFLVSVG